METNSTAIVTSSSYKNWYLGELGQSFQVDKVRGDLALEMISKSLELGFQIVVIDNGSSEAFIEELNKVKVENLVTNFSGTFSAARRKGYTLASKLPSVSVIAWIEPEKSPLINKSLIEACEVIISGKADIVIPARSDSAFSSLPPFQKESEKLGNGLILQIIEEYSGRKIPSYDIFFGPKIFANKPEILNLFLTKYIYKENVNENETTPIEGWSNALTFPIISAILKGYRVVSFEVNYLYPQKQTQVETGNIKFDQKRALQRGSLIKGTRELLCFFQDPNNSILSISKESPSGKIG